MYFSWWTYFLPHKPFWVIKPMHLLHISFTHRRLSWVTLKYTIDFPLELTFLVDNLLYFRLVFVPVRDFLGWYLKIIALKCFSCQIFFSTMGHSCVMIKSTQNFISAFNLKYTLKSRHIMSCRIRPLLYQK